MTRSATALAKTLIKETCTKEGIVPGQLGLHADRGASMKSHGTALLLATLGVTKTHSRPHVSNDNPFSEAAFKTLKYCPEFPDRFGSIEDARAFCRVFFAWYNKQHHHSGLGLLTPDAVHHGLAAEMTKARQSVLANAYKAHPERFVRSAPMPPQPPSAVWINRPHGDVAAMAPSDQSSTSHKTEGSSVLTQPATEVALCDAREGGFRAATIDGGNPH